MKTLKLFYWNHRLSVMNLLISLFYIAAFYFLLYEQISKARHNRDIPLVFVSLLLFFIIGVLPIIKW